MFTVIEKGSALIFDTEFALRRDDWDDYGFKTQFQLYASTDQHEPEFVGSVKILHIGQIPSFQNPLEGVFPYLNESWISVGNDLDYYHGLTRLSQEQRNLCLHGLQDAVRFPKNRMRFNRETAWTKSLFRDMSIAEQFSFLDKAQATLENNFAALANLSMEFSFSPAGWDAALELDYSAPQIPFKMNFPPRPQIGAPLPQRCAVLIGRNGSGKSTLLSRLAKVAYASASLRTHDSLKLAGILEPSGIGFMKVITISYSAFDSFSLPGVFIEDLRKLVDDMEIGRSRFVFCGLRNVGRELSDRLDTMAGQDPRTALEPQDRSPSTHLKTLTDLATEFEEMVQLIRERGALPKLENAIKPVLSDISFSDLNPRTFTGFIGDNARAAFMGRSTGHKICLHIIVSLIAHAVPQSLVLFDEPEAHLHPPLTAALMHSVRLALQETDAFAVIATHSPVVVQETLARHVRIISRHGDEFAILSPETETFGENIGRLVHDTLGLTSDETNFYSVLDRLCDEIGEYDGINNLFSHGLSAQARAYVLTRLAEQIKEA